MSCWLPEMKLFIWFSIAATSTLIYHATTKVNIAESTVEIKKGISFKTGLYYAMGLALIMEGVMSAAYHICEYLR